MNISGLCMCGCGQKTKIASMTRNPRCEIKGYPKKYLFGHQPANKGVYAPRYVGGIYCTGNRYFVKCRDKTSFPYARIVAEYYVARRPLTSEDIVHHINGNSADDDPRNLEVTIRSEHIIYHKEQLYEAQMNKKRERMI